MASEPDAQPDDAALLRAFAAGAVDALETLALRYERPLLGLCAGLLNGQADRAADVVQETWVRVIRSAATFRGASSVKTWLYRIALNECRRQRRRRSAPLDGAVREGAALTDPRSGLAGPATAADPPPAELERIERVRRAVAALPADRRDVVLLCYHTGMSHAEAAQILELPVGTLKSRLHAALNELRESLAQELEP